MTINLETFQSLHKAPVTSVRARTPVPISLQLPSIVLQIPGDLSRCPGDMKPGPPSLPQAGPSMPVCFSSVPEKPNLASLLFLFSGVSILYLRKGLLCSGDPILSWSVGEVMSERKMVFDKLVQFRQSHDFPVIAHHASVRLLFQFPNI